MGEQSGGLSPLRDQRLARYAILPMPAWLWSTDGSAAIWANPAGAACLGFSSAEGLAAHRFDPRDPLPTQIRRIAARLPHDGAPSLQRLSGLAPGIGRFLLCACSRLTVDRSRAALLVVAQQPAGRVLSLAEQAQRLLAASGDAAAVFTSAGALVSATSSGLHLLAGAASLDAIAAMPLAHAALADFAASGQTSVGKAEFYRLGSGDATALLVCFETAERASASAEPRAVDAAPALVGAAVAPAPTPIADTSRAVPGALPPPQPEPFCPAEEPAAAATDEPSAPAADVPAPAASALHSGPRPDETQTASEAVEPASQAVALDGPANEATDETVPSSAGPEQPAPGLVQAPPADDLSAVVVSPPPAPEPPPLRFEEPSLLQTETPLPERRSPLRFVWQMDAEGRFTLGSDEFTDVIGPRIALALGRPWREVAETLGLDPSGRVLRAIESQDTWSGITVSFPVEGSDERLDVELSGLPVYDRDRNYLGYRGFGVCRDIGRLAALGRLRQPPLYTLYDTPHRRRSDHEPDADLPFFASPSATDFAAASGDADAARGPAPENVVPFPAAGGEPRPAPDPNAGPDGAAASDSRDNNAFREIARQLHARLAGEPGPGTTATTDDDGDGASNQPASARSVGPIDALDLLDRLPVGLLVYRHDQLLYTNRAFLETTGYPSLDALVAAGGLESLFVAGDADVVPGPGPNGQPLAILTHGGDRMPVAARLFAIPGKGEAALALMLLPAFGSDKATDLTLRRAEATIRELRYVLDIAFDGVVTLAGDGRIASANHSAEVLFGAAPGGLVGKPFDTLFAPETRASVHDYLARIRRAGSLLLNEGREVNGQVQQGGTIPLFLVVGPMTDGSDRLCAVFRDLTVVKREAQSFSALRQEIERTAASKAEFVNRLSHDLRTPLDSILDATKQLLDERFGPLGDEQYRGRVRDLRAAAEEMRSLLDDTLELSQAESGSLELTFAAVDLNEVVQDTVREMQVDANRERIIIRTSLAPHLQPIVADARSLHQIIATLLTNAIGLTGVGGQVIVSTGQNEQGHVVLRVRDTGAGMSRKDIETLLQPLKEIGATPTVGGAGLGLPLTKALAEANRGTFNISSRVNDGTLVEVTFPRPRIPAE